MKKQELEFEKMRPYQDKEVEEAVKRIADNQLLSVILEYLFTEKECEHLVKELKQSKTIQDFILNFSKKAFKRAIVSSTDDHTCSGLENIDHKKPYLFISNHRDIALDSAILQLALIENERTLSQITFGSNLMSSDFIIDIGKLNRMFTLYRGGSRIQIYRNALLHSAYMSHVINDQKESIWIAQRDGRTKDGKDKTQLSLIKMLMASNKDALEIIRSLNIIPVAISYEYEPCDTLKVEETYKRSQGPYVKSKDEDLNSIIIGIMQPKGKVHLHFGKPVNNELVSIDDIDATELAEKVCGIIDYEIYQGYQLWKNNYIAFDLSTNTTTYLDKKYNEEDRIKFTNYLENKLMDYKAELKDKYYEMLLDMYASPILSKENN